MYKSKGTVWAASSEGGGLCVQILILLYHTKCGDILRENLHFDIWMEWYSIDQ